MEEYPRWPLWLAIAVMTALIVFLYSIPVVVARDAGQWEDHSPEIRAWFQSLRMPDNPTISCCGEADGYWCDDVHVKDGRTFCTITDDRDDEKLRRPHVPIGTVIEIPPHKLGNYPGNPVGHSIVFMNYVGNVAGEFMANMVSVYCFVQGSLI